MTIAVYTLDRFVEDSRALVRQDLDARSTAEALKPLLERIVSRRECLTDCGGDSSPEEGFPIYVDDTLTITTVVWKPGIGAPPHNHNTWALIGVVEGNEQNTNYRRTDDGSRPWYAQLEKVEVVDILPGQSAYILPPDDIHSVAIPGEKTVAIHVYGNNLRKQWRYQFDLETGEVKPFVGRQSGLGQTPKASVPSKER